ncbi:MAG TPA: alpha/beta hydrolase [Gammaproteobacteria bacterium]|nr:alpha/beta hydrolase [Gammaproteobacteria bacterium]
MTGRYEHAVDIAATGGLNEEDIVAGPFRLKVFHRGLEGNPEKLVVYIEGDGFAWKRKGVLSSDPTPKNPVALGLAARDPRASILYIARPCQFPDAQNLENCPPRYWSSHRYAEEVIASINEVIDHFVKLTVSSSIELIGYSGGGSIAALLAARRSDVNSLVTVVANLDHEAWTRIHAVSPLRGSLNATDIAESIQHIPQYHFVGTKDRIVPLSVTESFLDRITNPSHVAIERIPGFDHECCWVDSWPALLCEAGALDHAYCK